MSDIEDQAKTPTQESFSSDPTTNQSDAGRPNLSLDLYTINEIGESLDPRYTFIIDPVKDPHLEMTVNINGSSFDASSNRWKEVDHEFVSRVNEDFYEDILNKQHTVPENESRIQEKVKTAKFLSDHPGELWQTTLRDNLSNKDRKRRWADWLVKHVNRSAELAKEQMNDEFDDFDEYWNIRIQGQLKQPTKNSF
ncbi:hypothetical protein L486_04198 [Kwoniella mangroviensis CBS 10435]|uniref:Uncharacterized protein n=1 Tax=Kwoniella mangroviensis CBS 10435 TaxID=1331196 RepID=A0A1B9IRK4_9TREE|nr:uncharacterized protein I203_02710 [Kwoniella mangroviensis CBS 8507]OCF58168.1 hypothetical protein L486_04198 [Kwoniella mangroviensis CBS 10435]OCF68051.1 hypothetical protein I203_02710 [Kwoniella mangroviensis CBS 8507]OCF78176.1 hypothetical protein I204_00113 [Kwoniella mangroviensis CBS 8886]